MNNLKVALGAGMDIIFVFLGLLYGAFSGLLFSLFLLPVLQAGKEAKENPKGVGLPALVVILLFGVPAAFVVVHVSDNWITAIGFAVATGWIYNAMKES